MSTHRVGTVDPFGRLFCNTCAFMRDKYGEPVWSDAAPHNTEPCEGCGRALNGSTPRDCSICRDVHGDEVIHACE